MQRIAGAARLLATGKLALSTGFAGAQMQRRLMTWRAGGESINSLILQGGELQRARARQLVRTNPVRVKRGSELHRARGGLRHQAVVPGRGRRAQGRDPASVARLDRRGRRRWLDRLLWPPGHGRAGHVRGGRVLLAVPAPTTGRWPERTAAAADAVLGAPAARQVRDAAQRQRDYFWHRARPDRAPGRLPLPPHPPGRCAPAWCG